MSDSGFALTACSFRIAGTPVFVSTEDADMTAERWYKNIRYARGRGNKYMHRLIAARMYAREVGVVDHINGDPLDNRRCNLRDAGRSGNSRNQTHKSEHHTSRFKGVYWAGHAKMWRAEITVNYIKHRLGYFKNEADAQEAYAQAAMRLHGEFAAPYVDSRKQ